MVLDIAFSNTFFHNFLSEKAIFIGHSCVEGGGSCWIEEVFSGCLPSHLPRVASGLPGYRWGGLNGSEVGDTPFRHSQLWKRVCKYTLSLLLAALHRIGFSLTLLSHAPCPHGEAGNTRLWTSRVWCLYRYECLSDLQFPPTSLFQVSRSEVKFLMPEKERERLTEDNGKIFLFHRITEWWGCKGPLWVIIKSNPPAEAESPTAGCTGLCPGGSWISPEKETPQPFRFKDFRNFAQHENQGAVKKRVLCEYGKISGVSVKL